MKSSRAIMLTFAPVPCTSVENVGKHSRVKTMRHLHCSCHAEPTGMLEITEGEHQRDDAQVAKTCPFVEQGMQPVREIEAS